MDTFDHKRYQRSIQQGLREVAHHEAAHALRAHGFGLPVRSIMVGHSDGVLDGVSMLTRLHRLSEEASVQISLAGPLATLRFLMDHWPIRRDEGATTAELIRNLTRRTLWECGRRTLRYGQLSAVRFESCSLRTDDDFSQIFDALIMLHYIRHRAIPSRSAVLAAYRRQERIARVWVASNWPLIGDLARVLPHNKVGDADRYMYVLDWTPDIEDWLRSRRAQLRKLSAMEESMRDRSKMTPTALAFMEEVDRYREKHGVSEEEAIHLVRSQRREPAPVNTFEEWLERRAAQRVIQESMPAEPPGPYMVPWAKRDRRIEISATSSGFVIDMRKLLGDLGTRLSDYFGTKRRVYVSPINIWGRNEPEYRMTFGHTEDRRTHMYLNFMPHNKKLAIWARLNDIRMPLEYMELNTATSLDHMVRRLLKMLDKAAEKIDEYRAKKAVEVAENNAFIARLQEMHRLYPEFEWRYNPDYVKDASFENGRFPQVRGKVRENGVIITAAHFRMSDAIFAEFVEFLRRRELLETRPPEES